MPDLKLGALPPRPHAPTINLSALFPRGLPKPPAAWDATQGITDWGMLGNDTAGDCVVAGFLHLSMIEQKIATGRAPEFTSDEALALYTQLTGWDPSKPDSDTGLNVEDFLTLATQRTLIGQRLKEFAPVKVNTVEHLKIGLWLFDGINTAALLPFDAEDQFGAGQPWTTNSQQRDQPPLGGHDIPAVAYDEDGVTYVTWGTTQRASWDWCLENLQEAELLIPTAFSALTKALDNGYEPRELDAFLGHV